jgi:hypothetical protein
MSTLNFNLEQEQPNDTILALELRLNQLMKLPECKDWSFSLVRKNLDGSYLLSLRHGGLGNPIILHRLNKKQVVNIFSRECLSAEYTSPLNQPTPKPNIFYRAWECVRDFFRILPKPNKENK